MKNIMDILKGLGIDVPEGKEAELTRLVNENYKTIADYNKQTAKVGRVEQERDDLRSQLATAQDTLKGFEGVDLPTIQAELSNWKKKAEDAEKDYNDKLYQRDFEDALKTALEGIKFTSEAAKKSVAAEIRDAGLKLRDGKIMGLNDLVTQIKAADASAFVDEEQEQLEAGKARFTTKMTHSTGQTYKGRNEIMSIKDAGQRQRAIAQNIEMFTKGE